MDLNVPATVNTNKGTTKKTTFADLLEFFFFFYLIYSNVSTPLGLYIPYVAGVMLPVIAVMSLVSINWKRSTIIPMVLVASVAVTFLGVQMLVFETPLSYPYMRSFFDWVISAIVILSLCEQKGFINRLATVMFLIALLLLPFVSSVSDIVERQTVETGTSLENANTWAAWLGFCALVFWLWGWRQKKIYKKVILWILTFAAAIFMMKTVSRGALLALLVGILFGFRGIPRKKWVLVLILLVLFIFLIDLRSPELFSNYLSRLTEESGRLIVWPIGINAISKNPFMGYGLFKIVGRIIVPITPHNGILFIWLASGILPSIIFIALWAASIIRSLKANWLVASSIDPLPLIIYSFLLMNMSNVSHYMSFWSLATIFYGFLDNPSKITVQKKEERIG